MEKSLTKKTLYSGGQAFHTFKKGDPNFNEEGHYIVVKVKDLDEVTDVLDDILDILRDIKEILEEA